MKKKFTSTGTFASIDKPSHKKTILDDIHSKTIEETTPNVGVLKRQTFLLSQETIEKIKDFVYTQKIAGNILFTQKELIEQAIDCFLAKKNIKKRPAEFIEKRGRKT